MAAKNNELPRRQVLIADSDNLMGVKRFENRLHLRNVQRLSQIDACYFRPHIGADFVHLHGGILSQSACKLKPI